MGQFGFTLLLIVICAGSGWMGGPPRLLPSVCAGTIPLVLARQSKQSVNEKRTDGDASTLLRTCKGGLLLIRGDSVPEERKIIRSHE